MMRSGIMKSTLAIVFLVSLVYASDSEALMDISVTQEVDNATPKEGDTITYTVTAVNIGDLSPCPWPMDKVSIVDELPEEGLTDIDYSVDDGAAIHENGQIAWSLESFDPGDRAKLTITATVDSGTAGTEITNKAKLACVCPMDCNESNNIDYVSISVQEYDPGLKIEIDIKPGDENNSINLKSQGVIPVAILTTSDFDATTVDPLTVRFGKTGTEAAPMHEGGHVEDVDKDGDKDLLFHFRIQETGLQEGDTEAYLTGKLLSVQALTAEATSEGQSISGCDKIKTSKKAPELRFAGKLTTTWGNMKNRY